MMSNNKKSKKDEVMEQVDGTAITVGYLTEQVSDEDTPVMGVAVPKDTVAEDTAVLQEGEAEIDPSKPVRFVVNYPHGLNLRIGPGRNFAVKRVLANGSNVESIGEIVRAGNVEWVPLADGWVDGKYLELAGAEE